MNPKKYINRVIKSWLKMQIDVLTVIQIKGIINYSVGKLSTSNGNEHDKNHVEQTTHLKCVVFVCASDNQ